MVAFIDAHREADGVEPICAVLPIAPSTYYGAKARQADPGREPPRTQRDARLGREIGHVWRARRRVYGAWKVWRQLRRVRTTIPAPVAERPRDLVQRVFQAGRPNQLWLSDFTYVATWRGFVYAAFVIDVLEARAAYLSSIALPRTDPQDRRVAASVRRRIQ